jgi:hypothetical protein
VPARLANRACIAGPGEELHPMPSLLRFLVVIGVIVGLAYAAIYALATMVDPKPREITVTVPPDKFVKQPH